MSLRKWQKIQKLLYGGQIMIYNVEKEKLSAVRDNYDVVISCL